MVMTISSPPKLSQTVAESGVLRSCVAALVLSGLLSAQSALAQQANEIPIKIGETNLFPSLRLDYTQSDNAFLQSTDTVETTGFLIKPSARWVADRRLLSLVARYDGEYGVYSESALDYADHEFNARATAEYTSRKRIDGGGRIKFSHQPLGTNFTRGVVANSTLDQVEFIDVNLDGSFTYGAKKARGNLEFGLKFDYRSYQNNAELTSGSDFANFTPYGVFSLRISEDTRALAELRLTSVSFGASARDRTDLSLLGGMSFAATGKSGGAFRVGSLISNFAASNRDDTTTFVAEADLFYEPASFSRFDLTAQRAIKNDSGSPLSTDDALSIGTDIRLKWTHNWSSRVYHVANLNYSTEERDCPNIDIEGTVAGLEMNFVIRRWLEAGVSFNANARATSECATAENSETDTDYDRQVMGVHIRATL